MKYERRVVCAAIKKDGYIIAGPRHFDDIMLIQAKNHTQDIIWSDAEEGFIDQKGVFMDRVEALEVAKNAGQNLAGVVGNKLCSDNLY